MQLAGSRQKHQALDMRAQALPADRTPAAQSTLANFPTGFAANSLVEQILVVAQMIVEGQMLVVARLAVGWQLAVAWQLVAAQMFAGLRCPAAARTPPVLKIVALPAAARQRHWHLAFP